MRVVAPLVRVRRFISATLFLSFLVAVVSGVLLYLRPEGSLARWAGWSAIGLDKKQWEAVHIVFVLLLLGASLAHIAFNWKPLISSLFPKAPASSSTARRGLIGVEWLGAGVLVALALWATLGPHPPVTSLIAMRTALKNGAYSVAVLPPVTDADALSVAEVCRTIGLTEERAISNARAQNIVIQDPAHSLARVSREHGVSPEAVYAALQGVARP